MVRRSLKSFSYALKGLFDLFKTQPNAKIHLLLASVATGLGIFLKLSYIEWSILILTIAIVLTAEAFNTGLEYLTDLVSPEYHPLAGKAKDVAAAGVLITAIGAVLVGLCLFLPKLLS